MTNQVKFTVGGPVQAQAGTYLPRVADQELLNICQAAQFAYVLACRQIGKSSLMYETAKKLSAKGVKTAIVDLNEIGKIDDVSQWYFTLLANLAKKLAIKVDVENWWDQNSRLSPTYRFLKFLREVVLTEISGPVVIFVDEIDVTLGLNFTNDFFAAIRVIYNERAQHQSYNRLTFVLLGVATPDELIIDNTRTPFNIGRAIVLNDFTEKECEPFRQEIKAAFRQQNVDHFIEIYKWTNGHPYLTQKLCQAALTYPNKNDSQLVDKLIRKLFLAETRTEDNLHFVQVRVTTDPYAQVMLRIYRRVLQGEEVRDEKQSIAINKLKLYGLVVTKDGLLQVRNRLYTWAFDVDWVDEMLRSMGQGIPPHYIILQEIGQGSFATVYQAQLQGVDDKTQFRTLKVINLQDESESDWNKWSLWFEDQAQLIAKLDHPNIIRTLEVGRSGEKTLFIATPYIPGTLRQKLKTAPLPLAEAIAMIKQIGDALTYAHQYNILHLGLHPNNILLDTSEEAIRPVITDFGLANLLPQDHHFSNHRNSIKAVQRYMAPEQLQQGLSDVTADVYALAVTFFEMLTGYLPADRQPGEPLPYLSEVNPTLSLMFDDILSKATAKQPVKRFQSVAEFVETVEIAPQKWLAGVVEETRNYLGTKDPDLAKALEILETALEINPIYSRALRLRGEIRLKQGDHIGALADYKQAYEPQRTPISEEGIEYLAALDEVAEIYWLKHMQTEAVQLDETIMQIIGEGEYEATPIEPIQKKVWTRLVEYHYGQGVQAYATENSENFEYVLKVLENELKVLQSLKAERKSRALKGRVEFLHKKRKAEEAIKVAEVEISALKAENNSNYPSQENVFKQYIIIDQTYQYIEEAHQKYLGSEAEEPKPWLEERRRKLKEQVELRQRVADQAERGFDYETALQQYKIILNISETKYKDLSHELSFDLKEKIAEIQGKADYDHNFKEIEKLIDKEEYSKALTQLVEDFGIKGNYEHRNGDVARLLWSLVHTKFNGGKLPPSGASESDQVEKEIIQENQRHEQKIERWHIIPISIIGIAIGLQVGLTLTLWTQNIPFLAMTGLLFLLVVAIIVGWGVFYMTRRRTSK